MLSSPTAVTPSFVADCAGAYVLELTVTDIFGSSSGDTVTITVANAELPVVTVAATDAAASEAGPDPGSVTFTRTGMTTDPLLVHFGVGGSASAGTDYTALAGTVTISGWGVVCGYRDYADR